MTVVGGLMMAVVLTGYSVAGTYAKYTDSSSVTDNAYVAKWDVKLGINNFSLFSSPLNNAKVNNRVAPGGQDTDSFTVNYTNNSEVEVDTVIATTVKNNAMLDLTNVALSADQQTALDAAKVAHPELFDGNNYTPVLFTVERTSGKTENINTEAKLVAALANLKENETVKISWAWAYEVENHVAIFDYLDTQLGKQGGADSDKYIEIGVSITATQRTNSAASSTGTVSATIPEADMNVFTNSWGYDASLVNVTLADNKLTGEITESTNATLIGQFPESDPKGYYYVVNVSGAEGTVVKFGINGRKVQTIGADGSLSIMLALDTVNKTPIRITIGGETTEIDYSGVTFTPAA